MKIALAVLLTVSVSVAVYPQCTSVSTVHVGGAIHLDAGEQATFIQLGQPATYIDTNRPALAHVAADTATFSFQFETSNPVTVRFASFQPSGSTYAVRNASAPLVVTPFGTRPGVQYPEVVQLPLNPPLVFEPGDVLGVVVTPPAGQPPLLPVARGEGTTGTIVALTSDAVKNGPVDIRSGGTLPIAHSLMSAFVTGTVGCADIPSPEVILPVTGDLTGRAHYTTDVSVYISSALPTINSWPVDWTIRDRLKDPNGATAVNGSAMAQRAGQFFGDTQATLTSLPSNYLGPMIVRLPGASFIYAFDPMKRFSDDVTATARIMAQGPAGEVGSSVQGVSCERIGHVISVPFHRNANQRVNIGIASAQLASCGVFAPATVVLMTVRDTNEVGIPMPAESIQINDITSPGSPLPDAVGLTDGVVRIAVLDEAARIVAYASVVDNTSQAATITVGRVER